MSKCIRSNKTISILFSPKLSEAGTRNCSREEYQTGLSKDLKVKWDRMEGERAFSESDTPPSQGIAKAKPVRTGHFHFRQAAGQGSEGCP